MGDKRYTDEAIALARDLVRIPSDSGKEGAAAEALAERMRSLSFDHVEIDQYGSVVGVVEGAKPGKTVLLDGHLDTVPVPNPGLWAHDPYGGEIVDGRLYGRGSSDMKGAVAAMTCAAALLGSRKADLSGRVVVTGLVHEEMFEGIAARVVSNAYTPDYVVIGEASDLTIKRGQRGRAEIEVKTLGTPAHSANPQHGRNAVLMMARFLERLERLEPPEHPVLGRGICVVTDIISEPYPGASVVPSECRITLDRRLLVGETAASVLEPLQAAIADCAAQDPDFKAELRYTRGRDGCYTGLSIEGKRFFPGWLAAEDAPHVQAALAALGAVPIESTLSHYAFCTNGSHYAGEMDIPTIGFGPSQEHLAHITDEYIELAQIEKAVAGYAAIAEALLAL